MQGSQESQDSQKGRQVGPVPGRSIIKAIRFSKYDNLCNKLWNLCHFVGTDVADIQLAAFANLTNFFQDYARTLLLGSLFSLLPVQSAYVPGGWRLKVNPCANPRQVRSRWRSLLTLPFPIFPFSHFPPTELQPYLAKNAPRSFSSCESRLSLM